MGNYNFHYSIVFALLTITSVSGNVFEPNGFKLKDQKIERLKISRQELEKTRMRKKTDNGTDVGLVLESGSLRNGDILTDGDRIIVVEQLPEKVIAVKLKENSTDLLILIGHIIGNRHRPISIENGIVYFPIQARSELEVFDRLFSEIRDKIELSIEEKIFRPHSGADVHDHQ